MKKELKGFILGALTATLVTSGITFAAGKWTNIDVLENDVNVIVDGKLLGESNFVYNDRTYLPLRAVAEAVGKYIDYDITTNTVYVGGDIQTASGTNSFAQGPTPIAVSNTFQTTTDGLYLYEDSTGTKYVKLSDINSYGEVSKTLSNLSGAFAVVFNKEKTNWILECVDFKNKTMYDNNEVYGMIGGTLYVQDNYWYVLASDYTDIILPNLGYSTSLQKPLSDKFQIMKNPLAD